MRLITNDGTVDDPSNGENLVLLLFGEVARGRLCQAVLYFVLVLRLLGLVLVPFEHTVLYYDPVGLPVTEDILGPLLEAAHDRRGPILSVRLAAPTKMTKQILGIFILLNDLFQRI